MHNSTTYSIYVKCYNIYVGDMQDQLLMCLLYLSNKNAQLTSVIKDLFLRFTVVFHLGNLRTAEILIFCQGMSNKACFGMFMH